jgi:hypothetical protein
MESRSLKEQFHIVGRSDSFVSVKDAAKESGESSSSRSVCRVRVLTSEGHAEYRQFLTLNGELKRVKARFRLFRKYSSKRIVDQGGCMSVEDVEFPTQGGSVVRRNIPRHQSLAESLTTLLYHLDMPTMV